MERATISRIESWESRPVPGGYAGLSALEDEGFTGAVAAGGTRLFMLNGRVVGVFDGTLAAFEGAESTAYEAPDPALPLLFAMQERGGEVRGKYYTDDTPLREVDETLSEGGFTGYLELSENVLSGDYYVVYYGGRSLAAAFVGNEGRVVTGGEAFDLADDEVGIYEVRSVDIEVIEVPEPSEDEAAAAAGTSDADEAPAPDDEPPGGTGTAEADEPADDGVVEAEPEVPADGAEATVADAGAAEEPSPGAEAEPEEPPAEAPEGEPVEPTATATDDDAVVEDAEAGGDEAGGAAANETAANSAPSATSPSETSSAEAGGSGPSGSSGRNARAERSERPVAAKGAAESDPDERFREEERWREARTVPALDPDESGLPREGLREASRAPAEPEEPAPEPEQPDGSELETLRERVGELEAELESVERDRRRQAERAEELGEEREELLEERATLEARIEELEARIEEQEARIEEGDAGAAVGADAHPAGSGGTTGSNAIDPDTVLEQTDLFVRYGSKGKATLQTVHDGKAEREAVAENLRLETHSRFDPEGATVAGRPFEEHLADTIEYRFVAWLVEELLYEIQETGSQKALRALYDALPEIDRAEFEGTVSSVDEEGEERQEAFDVVCRDRMGKPLIVANINDSLDPATGEMMGELVEDATAAGEAHESLAAAFLVTASFFEPDALETASEATGGGFLSRDSKRSFVKLSRKGGYHLSLVEARGGEFHVAVPEF